MSSIGRNTPSGNQPPPTVSPGQINPPLSNDPAPKDSNQDVHSKEVKLSSSQLEKLQTSQTNQEVISRKIRQRESLKYEKPPRPVRSNMMQEKDKRAWIDRHTDPLSKKAVTHLIKALQHVSQETFETKFAETLKQFKQLKLEHYVAAVEARKSNK